MFENKEIMKQCTICVKTYPLSDWLVKPNGDVYQLCEFCRNRYQTDWKKSEDARLFSNSMKCVKYHIDQEYRNKKKQQSKLRDTRRVKCVACEKEMDHSSLLAHSV